MTLQEATRFDFVFDCRKHELAAAGDTAEDYADKQINKMSHAQFLAALSEGLERMREEGRRRC